MIKLLFLVFIAFFFTNCSTKNLSPLNVSDYFWSAQQSQKLDDAKKFVREVDKKNIALQKGIKIKSAKFEKAIVDGDTATVPTKLTIEGILSKAKKDEVLLSFDTKLDNTKEGWKVNLAETKKLLYIETAKTLSKGLGDEILKQLQERMGDFKQFQSIFEEMLSGMKKSLQK